MGLVLYDIYPIIILIIVLFAFKPIKTPNQFNENYLSKETCLQLRGILAIIILLYHVAQKINGGLLSGFTTFGYLMVSVFYFLSGYGLQKQFIFSAGYRRRFLLKRLPKIIIPYIISVFLFLIMKRSLLGEQYSLGNVLLSFINGHPIVTYSWYIISIFVYYIVYWIIMVCFSQSYKHMLLSACVWQLLYIFICWKFGFSEWWYSDSHLFVIGMIWACYEKKLITLLKKYYSYIWPMSIVMLVVLQYIRVQISLPSILHLVLIWTIPAFVVLSIICLLLKNNIRSDVLKWLGGISLEIYILQGLPIKGLRNNVIYIQNDFVWISLIICITIGLAWILNAVSSKMYKAYLVLFDRSDT